MSNPTASPAAPLSPASPGAPVSRELSESPSRPAIAFHSAYDQGFARVAAVTLPVALANPAANAQAILTQVRALSDEGAALAVFPELSLTGYSIDDLLLSDVLLAEVLTAIETIRRASTALLPVIVVGAPLRLGNRLYNCAVIIAGGRVRGVAPKSYLPNYREFYEKRHFAEGADAEHSQIHLPGVRPGGSGRDGEDDGGRAHGTSVPFGPDLLFQVDDVPGLTLHVEVCEDMWVPVPPSSLAALAGASVLVNLSGSPITVGRAEDRKLLARASSSRNLAAYIYAAAGQGESSTDLAWDGQTFVYENGALLGQTERFPDGPRATVVDIDLEGLAAERLRQGSFEDNRLRLGVRETPKARGQRRGRRGSSRHPEQPTPAAFGREAPGTRMPERLQGDARNRVASKQEDVETAERVTRVGHVRLTNPFALPIDKTTGTSDRNPRASSDIVLWNPHQQGIVAGYALKSAPIKGCGRGWLETPY